MIYKSFVILLIVASCTTQPVKTAKKIEVLKEEVKPSITTNLKECRKKTKALKYLAKFQKDKVNYRWLTKNSSLDLCEENPPMLKTILNKHSGKIVVLYEEGKLLEIKNNEILKGIKKSSKEEILYKGVSFRKNKNIDKVISDLIYKEKVGIIITWGEKKFLKRVSFWQKRLDIPALVIGNDKRESENKFKVFPNRNNYTSRLVESMKKKGIKRIAILTPAHYEKSSLLKGIIKDLKENEIEIVYDVIYDSNNYDSMNMACRTIFEIDRSKRHGEYMAIMRSERRKAKAKGFKLNRKLVFLPARVNYDAILIPDNFKIVNHFVKLFEYYQMPRIPLIGTYEWRSKDLVKSKHPLLQGALFVDFIGDPNKLPTVVKKENAQRKRIGDSLGLGTDYQLMGYYSSKLASISVKASKNKRKLVSKILKKVKIKDRFFQNKPAFKGNDLNWPSFLFEVNQGEITLAKKQRNEKK